MPKIYEYNTEAVDNLFSEHSLYENREKLARFTSKEYKSEVTICISMYKDLDKAKRCVESVLRYTKGIDFDLVLLIDGPKDGLFDYFKNIEYEKTTIIYNTANRGGSVPWTFLSMDMLSEFVVGLAGDLVLTENWLNNLLKCIKSDPTTGMVVPVSSNSSNLQEYYIGDFKNYDEMQKLASDFNRSDPGKWEERLRIITLGTVFRKSALYTLGIPMSDIGFAHNFSDDEMAFRMRRMGYKCIVAADTWIHHDHVRTVTTLEEKNEFDRSIEIGRQDFKNKYFGIDAWIDVNNFVLFRDKIQKTGSDIPAILGIDVKCGTPILDIKNKIRQFGKLNAGCFAITSDPKYYTDLMTICGAEQVVCGDVVQSIDKFVPSSMDYIIIDKYINQYQDPFGLITKCATLLKNDGHIYVYLKNSYDLLSYLDMLGYITDNRTEMAYNYTYSQFVKKVKDMGGNIECVLTEKLTADEAGGVAPIGEKLLQKTINMSNDPQGKVDRIMTRRWAFDITLG